MRVVRSALLPLLLAGAALAQQDDVAAIDSARAEQIPPIVSERRAAFERLESQVSIELRRVETDYLERFRRADGTVDWSRALDVLPCNRQRDVPNLPLGVFLRELARTIAVGRRDRVEELFDGVARTDLYHEHGLLSLGGRLTAVKAAPRLQRFLGPAFVRQLLRAQTDLATAHLLPQLARGNLHKKTFAISLAGLGLDERTVRDEISSMPWVAKVGGLRLAHTFGILSKVAKLSTMSGFIYTVGETVVVVYFADDVEAFVRSYSDRVKARYALGCASEELLRTLGGPDLTAEKAARALDAWDLAFGRWRDHLLAPALEQEARLATALEPLAREAYQLDEMRTALLARVPLQPDLMDDLIGRYGSLEAWFESRRGDEEQALRAKLEELLAAHGGRVEEKITDAYAARRTRRAYAEKLPDASLLPVSGMEPVYPFLDDPSVSRLETYQDQRDLLARLRGPLVGCHGEAYGVLIDEAVALVDRTEALDRSLLRPTSGVRGALDFLGR